MNHRLLYPILFLLAFAAPAAGGEADVVEVEVRKEGNNTYSFYVTVKHDDAGWKHYADKWDILDEKGNIVGTRVLYHPHVDEQPFTRSLPGVKIPDSISRVEVRAHDSVHEYGGSTITVELP